MTNYKKRKYISYIFLFVSFLAALIGLFWLVFILLDVFIKGFSYLSLHIFLEESAPPLLGGGGIKTCFDWPAHYNGNLLY